MDRWNETDYSYRKFAQYTTKISSFLTITKKKKMLTGMPMTTCYVGVKGICGRSLHLHNMLSFLLPLRHERAKKWLNSTDRPICTTESNLSQAHKGQ